MKYFSLLIMVAWLAASGPAQAFMNVSCSSTGAGVGGLISDTDDIVAAINCLGKQIADVRSNSPLNGLLLEQDQNSRLASLAAKSLYLETRLEQIERRLTEIELRLTTTEAKKDAR